MGSERDHPEAPTSCLHPGRVRITDSADFWESPTSSYLQNPRAFLTASSWSHSLPNPQPPTPDLRTPTSDWSQLTILLLISWKWISHTFSTMSSLSNVTNPNPRGWTRAGLGQRQGSRSWPSPTPVMAQPHTVHAHRGSSLAGECLLVNERLCPSLRAPQLLAEPRFQVPNYR